ncbi:hypothetical protein A3K64_01105 [Candidatus Micrarchaeota archaeon RBG_16_36_9]|nr:MAG: hypothetical protein A3K64_01105 [Candidatus Micrarchaeota archaeon RBG_16_36_9]
MAIIKTETGKNIEDLIKYENGPLGIRMTGYPKGLDKALGLMLRNESQDKPGKIDDIARALESDNKVLYRYNFKDQPVPKRVEEYMEDRQDFVIGGISDYFLAPVLKIINGFYQGHKKHKGEAERFIEAVNERYPLDVETKESKPESETSEPSPALPGLTSPYALAFNYNIPNCSYSTNFPMSYSVKETRKASDRKSVTKKTPKTKSKEKVEPNSTNNNTATANANGNTVYLFSCGRTENDCLVGKKTENKKDDDWLTKYKDLYF